MFFCSLVFKYTTLSHVLMFSCLKIYALSSCPSHPPINCRLCISPKLTETSKIRGN